MESSARIKFQNILRKHLVRISDDQIDLLEMYVDLLSQWNKKINLVSRKDEENIWSRHVIGSISFLFQFELSPKSDIVDIGTGGGLPGIPLAILYPESRLSLIDSIQKKIAVVDRMIETLHIKNASAYCGRAEELSKKKEFQGTFDFVISRAVAPVRDIVKWSGAFLRRNVEPAIQDLDGSRIFEKGSFLFLKGGDLTDEISSAKVRFKPVEIHNFELRLLSEIPELTDKRIIVLKP